MKKTLLNASGNVITSKKALQTLLLVFAFWIGFQQNTTAQCIGPYQVYEGVPDTFGAMTGWNTTGVGFDVLQDNAASGFNRSGWNSLYNYGGANEWLETPTIADPSAFSFYASTFGGVTYDLQINDGSNGWESLKNATNRGYYGVTAFTLPANLSGFGTFDLISVTFGGTANTGRSNSNVKLRIVDISGGSLLIDDISWTSRTVANNTIFIPALGNTTTCTQNLATGSVYTLYDNGGDSDYHAYDQDNIMTFTAATPGDIIRITFNSFNTIDGSITVYNNSTNAAPILLSNHTGGLPGTVVYNSTAGSITLQFLSGSDPGTSGFGYDITVECISGSTCFAPSGLAFAASGGYSHNQAFLSWTAHASATSGYEVYYSTSNTPPTSGTAANGGTTVTTTATVSGLSSSTLYYFWVRSDCGAGGKSSWLGPISATTLCTPQTVTYLETFNGLVGGVLPTCTSASSASWQSNNANGNLFTNAEDTSFFTQGVTLTAGTLYRLTYDYSSNLNGEATMEVFVGHPTNNTRPTVSNINQAIAYNADFSVINTNVVNFTPAVSGTYYIRFYLESLTVPATGALNLDNIKLELETCLWPTFAATSPIAPAVSGSPYVTSVTDFGATLSWNVPSTGVPSNGYYYFISTSNTAPNYNDVATGSVGSNGITLTTLSPNTRYYVWVRSNCGGQVSIWSPTYATFVTTNISAPTVVPISNTTYTVACGANITFTDTNPTGNYLDNENNTITFVPDAAGQAAGAKLMVIFNTFNTEDRWDGLMIYSGSTVSAPNLMSSGRAVGANAVTCPAGAYSGTGTQSPGSILSTAANGALTFQFRTDGSVVRAGWTASIICVTNVPNITSFTPADNNCGAPSTTVVITGTNFSGITNVTFNGVSAAFVVNSLTQITATVPAGATTGKIKVFAGLLSTTSATNFSVNNPPPTTTNAIVCQTTTGSMSSSTSCDISGLTTFNGSLTNSNPTAVRPFGGTTCTLSGTTAYYSATQITVSVTGTYTLQTTDGGIDFFAYIVSGAFTPGSCATGTFIAADDDSGAGFQPLLNVNLTAGVVYTLYMTTFAAGVTGSYTWNVTPPVGGTVSLYQSAQVEWYTVASGGTPIGTGSTFNPIGVAGSPVLNNTTLGTWTFYAACSSNPTCRTATTFTISAANPGTASSDQNVCSGSAADLTLTGNAGVVTQWQYASNIGFTVGVTNIASSNSTTLTSAQIGTFTGTRYFRAEVAVGSCTVYSNVITITFNKAIWNGSSWSNGTGPTATIGADFQGDYTSSVHASATSGNLSACSVVVTSGNVLFDIGTLTVQNAVAVNSGTLTFNNNASLLQPNDVANAVGVYSGGNSGDIRYNRTTTGIRKYDYTYWSTPVNPQTLVDVSPDTPFEHYYYFNASINNWQYIASNNLMDVGKGYIIRAPYNFDINTPANYTAMFEGVPNNGTLTTPIVGGAGQMNLIGNPYPSALSASAFILDAANANVNGTIYLWTHNTPINGSYQYTGSDYAIYNLVGGTSAATNPPVGGGGSAAVPMGYIAAGQGFFIKGFSNGTATFKNNMRAAGNNSQFYRLSPYASNTTNAELNLEKHRYWLDITNSEGAYKQALIGYVETATNGIDRLFDGEMIDVGNAVTLYTIVDNTKLSIQGKELAFDVNETIPLGYKSTINTTYTISLPDFDGLFETQNIYLEDTLLNVIHDLKAAPYSFATNSGTFDERFILRYTTEALGTIDPVFNENTVVVYQNNAGLHINTGTENMKNVTIFDVRGREIASQKQIANTDAVFTTLPTTQQVLLVKIEGENGGIVTKKVVY